MKNLTKLFFIVIIIIFGIRSYAQTINLKAGLNLSNMLIKDEEGITSENLKSRPGFHIGGTLEYPLTDIFAFEPGLLLTTKGVIVEASSVQHYENYDYGQELTYKLSPFYLDIPLTGKASYEFSEMKIYGILGPYIGIGLGGNMSYNYTYYDYDGKSHSNDEKKIKWGSDKDNDDLKRLDFGLVFGAGVEITTFQLGLSYSLGLSNISPYTGEDSKLGNRVFSINLGYKLPVELK